MWSIRSCASQDLPGLQRSWKSLREGEPQVEVSRALVATIEGEVVGFVCWDGDLHLQLLFVELSYRRMGIGGGLLRASPVRSARTQVTNVRATLTLRSQMQGEVTDGFYHWSRADNSQPAY